MKAGSSYRWLVLLTTVVGTVAVNYANMVFASRPVEMMAQFAMDQAQLTAITTIGLLPGALFSIVLGNYFDSKGSKTMRFVGALLLFLGAACMLWRVFANNYVLLVVITFLAGTLFLPTQVMPFKMIGAWFNRQQISVGMGIYGAAAGIGIMLAFAIGGMLPTSTAALMSCFVCYLLAAVLWLLFAKMPEGSSEGNAAKQAGDKAAEQAEQHAAPKTDLKAVLRIKTMWLAMICSFVAASAPLLFNSYIVNVLISKGIDPAITGWAAVVFNAGLILGAILAGSIAGKLGKYNGVFFVNCVGGGLFLFLTYAVPAGMLSFVCLGIAGLILAGSMAINMTRIGLIPLTGDFGPENAGIAGGMNNTAMGLGMFILPTVAAAIFGNNYLGIFVTIFVLLAVVGVIGTFVMPELGENGELAKKARAK